MAGLREKFFVLLGAAMAFAQCAVVGEIRATGFIPPRNRIHIERQDTPKQTKALLGARFSSASLPSKWDSRDKDGVTSVKDQGNVNSCWAFSACAVLETQLLKSGRGVWDLSEKNMVNNHGFDVGFNDGGNDYMALAYLLRWGGAVAETNDVYIGEESSWTASPQLRPAVHVQNVVWVPGRSGPTDNDALKTAIMTYGAVSTSIYWGKSYESNSNYYCNVEKNCEHAIAVIGWDDNYSTNNFKYTPPGNGAFIIKNSWGTSLAADGYWYVSYYDRNFAMYEGSVFIPATDEEDYDAVYGYDKLGPVFATSNDNEYALEAAVFTSAWNEEIAAVGIYSNIQNNPYEISIWTNVTRTTVTNSPDPLAGGALAASVSGTFVNAGFATIHIPEPIRIADGTDFAVVYRQTGSMQPHIYCGSDDVSYSSVSPQLGNTYFGKTSPNATNWTDLAVYPDSYGTVACIKAYTRSTVKTQKSEIPNEFDDGTAAIEWLAATNALLYTQTSETFGAFANIVGGNSRTLWTSYVAGFNPDNPDDGEFKVSISVTNGIPYLTWMPNLGETGRDYTIYGADSLETPNWQPVEDLATTASKFFKVSVSPK